MYNSYTYSWYWIISAIVVYVCAHIIVWMCVPKYLHNNRILLLSYPAGQLGNSVCFVDYLRYIVNQIRLLTFSAFLRIMRVSLIFLFAAAWGQMGMSCPVCCACCMSWCTVCCYYVQTIIERVGVSTGSCPRSWKIVGHDKILLDFALIHMIAKSGNPAGREWSLHVRAPISL